MSDVEVEVTGLTVEEAIAEMVEGGITKEAAHQRMRDAMRSFNCSHDWQPDGEYSSRCDKCGCHQIHEIKAYFGLNGEEGEA